MKHQPLVSVLITVYNDQKNIAKAIESILRQTYQQFQIVVVNDGSTDDTSKILERYKADHPQMIVVSQLNAGTANAANTGLRYCTGKYVARLDSDDWSYPYRLEEEVHFLESNPEVGLVGGGCDIADIDGRIIGVRNIYTKHPYKTLLNRCIYQQSDVMIRKEVLDKLGPEVYRAKFKGAEDYDLWLRLSEITSIKKLDRVFSVWTLNTGGYTLARKQEQLEAINELKKMAAQRRLGKQDWYNEFQPKALEAAHRTPMPPFQYDVVVAQVLLKQLRTTDVKKQLEKYKSGSHWQQVKTWYYLSFLPKVMLKGIFGFREFLLNKSFIELR